MSSSAAGSLNNNNNNNEQFDPPPYTPPSGLNNNYGFPTGYFVIKNLATGKLLDVGSDSLDDGADVILWPEKETSLVEGKTIYALLSKNVLKPLCRLQKA